MSRPNETHNACTRCNAPPSQEAPWTSLCDPCRAFYRSRSKPVNDSRTAKPVVLTDQERIWLAGLLGDHIQRMGETEHPDNATEAAEVMRDIAWGVKLKRRLWEGVEL